jgi:hypothetical protein
LIESEVDALVDALKLSDVDADKLADSLGVMEAEAAVIPTAESLVEVDPLVVVESLEAVEPLVVVDSLEEVDSDAADSLVLCDVDSVAELLVAPVLPGVRTALPSVARVFRLAAVTSYETGVMSDMIYSPSSPYTMTNRIVLITIKLRPLGPDLQRQVRFKRSTLPILEA